MGGRGQRDGSKRIRGLKKPKAYLVDSLSLLVARRGDAALTGVQDPARLCDLLLGRDWDDRRVCAWSTPTLAYQNRMPAVFSFAPFH